MKILKPVKITWKEKEIDIHDYTWTHSSPSAWIKDLIKIEYERENYKNTKDKNESLDQNSSGDSCYNLFD